MSQTSLKQKKKNESGTKYSKDNLETERRRDSEKSGARLSTQMRRADKPNHSLRCCAMRGHLSCRHCLSAAEGTVLLGPCRTIRIYIHMCLLWEQGRQITMIRLPNSSTTSRTSSTSLSQQELPQQLSAQPSPPTPPMSLDPSPPTPPETQPKNGSRRSSKMHENPEAWAHGIVRDVRDSWDTQQPREYQRTPPTEWKSYAQRRALYPTQEDRDCVTDMLRKREEEDDDEAYWSSVKMLYEKTPSCSRPRPPKPKHAITIAVSSRALFNMVDGRKIYEEEGLEKYMEYQLTNENVILTPGPAFRFVKALQHVNCRLRELYPDEQDLFDIVLMTNNHAQVGVRLINSVNHYGLLIDRFCLTGGKSPIGYLKAYLTNLYLSADSEKVQEAIQEGIASATMFDGAKDIAYCDTQLRVAFDGDAVLFSDESDHIAKEHGLDKFFQHEALFENKPLAQGPLKGFLEDLGRLQKKFYAKDERLLCPIRTYLVTARSAASSGARVLKTLRRWGLEIDEALFLAGAPKGPILVKIRPHIFFDDQMFHIQGAQKFGTVTAHVPYGISQKMNT
ncbi:cytosolic 5'-nucleotidase 1B isoform X2 [Equus przewalskii]|uniref:Cytosolic 5'-nucleotidase 1B isoform X2 n=1 Tax=Equus przewalskii TaxID=9798 RepID=A0ABM2EU09_EQUPR